MKNLLLLTFVCIAFALFGQPAPQPGDLVITEIMQNPSAVSDANGEWFEIHNTTGAAIDLNGCTIRDDDSDSHTIGSSLVVPAGGYAVLGRNGAVGSNGGVTIDYVYGTSFTLANSDDEVVIECGGVVIDSVEYDGGPSFPDPTGASMSLDPANLDASSNDDGANWCESVSTFGDGDFGTPGAGNDNCPANPFQHGNLVITEIMQNPSAVSDANGEWFEIHNASGVTIDLNGCSIRDDDIDAHTVASPLVIGPGAYLVLGRNANAGTNGGVNVDYEYEDFLLANGDDEIIIECSGVVMDSVEYDGGPGFPDPTGASMSLDLATLDATSNDIGANWCEASVPFGDGDLGTPGMANNACCGGPVVYVDSAAAGSNDGTSWANAYTDLQEALESARSCSYIMEVWVAKGTYYPTTCNPCNGGDRDSSFRVRDDLRVYGGFSPDLGVDSLHERDWRTYETILCGDIGQQGDSTDNAYHVVWIEYAGPGTLLDGFTVRDGNANGGGNRSRGGGLYNVGSNGATSPVIRHCAFRKNYAGIGGGAVYNYAANGSNTSLFESCRFCGNRAGQSGGAVFNDGNNGLANPGFINCTFFGNFATAFGGAIVNFASNSGICNATYTNCTVTGNAGAIGGGTIEADFDMTATVAPAYTNTIIWGNSSGVDTFTTANPGFTNCLVQDYDGSIGTGNLDGTDPSNDPLFFDMPAFGDAPVCDGNLHQAPCSPVIDAGTNATFGPGDTLDLDGNQRIFNMATADLGAYEFQGEPFADTILYVDSSATSGNRNGSSWADAFTDLQEALATAHTCGFIKEVRVAEGTYYPTDDADRAVSFWIRDSLRVYGGFSPADGADSIHERDWTLYETILCGDIGQQGDSTDNSYHVVRIEYAGPDTELDGFTIRNGQADGADNLSRGGGLYNVGNDGVTSPVIRHCAFRKNYAGIGGGAVYNYAANGTNTSLFESCHFCGNRAGQGGGAVFNDGNNGLAMPAFLNCAFSGNSASGPGGAIVNFASTTGTCNATYTNCTISGNTGAFGGGTLEANFDGTATVIPSYTNTIIWGNSTGVDSLNTANPGFQYCLVEDYDGSIGTGNLDGTNPANDPLFVVAVPSPAPNCGGDLHLLTGSPAINAGDDLANNSTEDISGKPRKVGTIDLGAFEYQRLILEIYEIQGSGASSPVEGKAILTQNNVVTGVGTNGFFIQTPEARTDGDMMTSDGIFVFTGGAPSVTQGDLVDVEADVVEFFGLTELTAPLSVTVVGSGALPAPIVLDGTDPSPDPTTPSCGINNLECREGMLVEVVNGIVVQPNDQFGDIRVTAGNSRTFRDPGIEYPGLPGLPVWDGNPEIFDLNPDGLGLPDAQLTAETRFDATGPLTFSFGDYSLLPSQLTINTAAVYPIPVDDPEPFERTAATYSFFRFFDDVDDPGGDQVVTTLEYDTEREKLARYILEVLKAPDVIAVQEAEKLAVLQDLAAEITGFDPTVMYDSYLVEGNDPGGIDLGYLVRADRFQVSSVTQLGAAELFTFDGSLLHERPPLLLEGSFLVDGMPVLDAAFLNIHPRSPNLIDDPVDGPRVRQKRLEQAQSIAQMTQDFQSANPDTPLAVLGCFNGTEFTDGYVDLTGQVAGNVNPADNLLSGPDLVNPDLDIQTLSLVPEERYSFILDGTSIALDHILTSEPAIPYVTDRAYGRGNADVPWDLMDDDSNPLRSSDHDGMVMYLRVVGHLEVAYRDTTVENGDETPSTADGTDFGEVCPGSMDSFYLKNTAAANLVIDTVKVLPWGSNPGAFTYNTEDLDFPLTIAQGDSVLLKLTFLGPGLGPDSAEVVVESNDQGQDPFTFVLAAIGETVPPVAYCRDVTVYLDGNLQAVVEADDVNDNTTDNCGIDTLFVEPDTLDCSDLGVNDITLTVKDEAGNSDTCHAKATVVNDPGQDLCCLDGETDHFFIDQVSEYTSGQSNPSGDDGGYGDYTNFVFSTISPYYPYLYFLFTPGSYGPPDLQNWELYIDWNENDIFEPSEKILDYCTSISFARFLPLGGHAGGLYRMRLVMQSDTDNDGCQPGELPNPLCGSIGDGEVEDYTIEIAALSQWQPQPQLQDRLQVFPNPASDEIFFTLSGQPEIGVEVEIEVVATTGNLLRKQSLFYHGDPARIDISGLPFGTYFLRVNTGEEVFVETVIKQ